MQVLGLDHVALPVRNLDVSCQFYSEALLLELMARPNFDFPGAWYKLGAEHELHLLCRGAAVVGLTQSYDRHFALRVSCVHAAAEHLGKLGWPYREPKQRPDGVWQLFLRDPDDYSIELFSGQPLLREQ